jgi:hypothetical protein
MGFKAETAGGRALAIRAGKNNRTPVFVDLEKLAAAKGKDRIKFLKEEADRGQLSASVAKAVDVTSGRLPRSRRVPGAERRSNRIPSPASRMTARR